MAVYTKLNEENLKDILSNYNLGKLDSFKGIEEGIEIQIDSKAKLDKEIHEKKEKIEKEIEKELIQAQKEITELKKNSISDMHNISKEIAANIIENISGDKLNESSIKAAVEEISKKNVGKYLWQ